MAIQSEREIKVEPELLPFMDKEQGTPDVDVSVSWDWEKARKPLAAMVGQDLIQNYYIEDEGAFCMTREARKVMWREPGIQKILGRWSAP